MAEAVKKYGNPEFNVDRQNNKIWNLGKNGKGFESFPEKAVY